MTTMPGRLTATVAMATYNGARHIEDQLASIAAQTRLPDRLVVADDGSTDDTLAIVRRMASRLPFPTSVVDGGARVGAVLNFERALAQVDDGVVFLSDQDDVWMPEKVAVCMARFERAPEVKGLFTDGSIVSPDPRLHGRSLWDSVGFTPALRRQWAVDPLGVLLRANVVTGASVAFRADALPLLLPFPAGGWHDLSIAVLLASLSTFEARPEALIGYRMHGGNTLGVPTGSRRSRVADRRRHLAGLVSQERHWTELRDRMLDHGAPPETAARIDAKIAHLIRRRTMPEPRIRRLVPAVGELRRGGYGTYAAGNWSFVRDVVGP